MKLLKRITKNRRNVVFEKVKETIEQANNIYLVAHVNPDGDAIGASFGLCLA